MSTVARKNPLKAVREEAGLTLLGLSSRAGVSRQLIIRNEQGLYSTPSPRLLDYLVSGWDFTAEDLTYEYQEWQRDHRRDNYGKLLDPFPVGDYMRLLGIRPTEIPMHPFVYWRSEATTPPLNPTEVAKNFCVHQATLYKFENQPYLQRTIPGQLLEALSDAGYSMACTAGLAQAFTAYKTRLAEGVRLVS